MTFEELQLHESLCRAVRAEGYTTPTPIQAQAIPLVLSGRDLLGCAQTGTGKTAAFALPILHRLRVAAPRPSGSPARPLRCLVLTPTRELASQVAERFEVYGRGSGLQQTIVFGGVGQEPQVKALRRGVDLVVATPGRLLDLIGQRAVSFAKLEVLVLDEADRMLDMGFIHDVKRILAVLPRQRQTLFFSATMPPEIVKLSSAILSNPARVSVRPEVTTAEGVEQRLYHVAREDKRELLLHVLGAPEVTRALVFTRTKSGANRVTKHLLAAGLPADVIHGNKSQNARERAMDGFRGGDVRVLVATDIAARGIDVDGVSHVINFELPNVPETYVHRIGRTGRAGATGVALSFCDGEERAYLKDIERSLGRTVPVVEEHPMRARSRTGVSSTTVSAEGAGRDGAHGRGAGPRRDGGRRSERPHERGDRRGGPRGAERGGRGAGRGGGGASPSPASSSGTPAAPSPEATGRRYLKWG